MTSLYALTKEYKEIEMDMQDSGMDAETIHDTLEGVVAPLEEKAVNVAKFIGNMDMEIVAIKDAAAQMGVRAKALQSKRDSMIAYLKRSMESADIDRISCPFFELAVVKNPAKLVVTGVVPKKFMKQKPAPPPENDTAAIKAACKAGNLKFAHLEHSTRLRIK